MYLGGIPIISLDRIYLTVDNNNIYFIDCTRLDQSSSLVSRLNYNDKNSVERQVIFLAKALINNGQREIILADDVVFSGNVLKSLIEMFKQNGINVVGIRSSITTIDSFEYFNKKLSLGLKSGFILEKDVIDQICERDFYFGIVGSGILVRKQDGNVYKSPYFSPYGDAVTRASIPSIYEKEFSQGCLYRSLLLWNAAQKMSEKEIIVGMLPERINNTSENEIVIENLERSRRRIWKDYK